MEKEKIEFAFESQLLVPTLKADGSATIKFATGELSRDEINVLLDHKMELGWLIFSPNKVQPEEIPDEDAEIEPKKPSVRLRNSLYVLWEQQGKKGDFNDYYKRQMEKIIDAVKAKLI